VESYIVSARKYRPTTFTDVVGQKHVAETLMHEITNNKLAQAFLFTGPRGVGKTTCARILAKVINQQNGENLDHDFAFNIFELDAASNNQVDDIRNLIDQVRIPPQVGKYKVYIIDEVHMLTTNAFNAFLKTLEEPPSYAIFILATTEKHKILPTILSRCQVFNFNRIETKDMVEHLAMIAKNENVQVSEDVLHLIANKADGGLRDALSLFDQLASFSAGEVTYEKAVDMLNILDVETFFSLTEHAIKQEVGEGLLIIDRAINQGFDGSLIIGGFAQHFRNLMVSKDSLTNSLLDVSESYKIKYKEQSSKLSMAFLLNALNITHEADEKFKSSRNPRLLIEVTYIKLSHVLQFVSELPTLEEVKKKLTSPKSSNSDSSSTNTPKSMVDRNAPSIKEDTVKKVTQTRLGAIDFKAFKNQKNSQSNESNDSINSNFNNSTAATKSPNTTDSNVPKNTAIKKELKSDAEIINSSISADTSFNPKEPFIDSQSKQTEIPQNHSTNDLINPIEQNTHDSQNRNSTNAVETPLVQTLKTDHGLSPSPLTVEGLIAKISANKSPRIVSLLKSVKCDIQSNSFKITASSQLHMVAFEELRISLTQDLIQHSNGQITEFVLEMGEVEYSARRPYTDKEKLDYLIEKHPKLLDAMEKLQLRLP